MNKEQFTGYLLNPESLKGSSLSDLTALVKEFPYCQSGHILLILKLFLDKNVLYDSELKTTAVYAGSRRVLKKHIDRLSDSLLSIVLPDEEFMPGAKTKQPVEGKKQTGPHDSHTFKAETLETDFPKPSGEGSGYKDSTEKEETHSYTIEELKKIIEERIREIEFEKQKGKKANAQKKKDKSKSEIIDEFIENKPSISKPKTTFFDPVDVAKQSVVDKENIVSETLANIYMDQGHFEKAIHIYEKLILKFPEKSTYFAPLIENAKKSLKN